MFDKDKKKAFYKCEDYTVRMEKIDGIERYFIKFNMTGSPEYEITLDTFKLYYKKFNRPLERQKNEHRRHIEDGDIEYSIASGKLTVHTIEDDDRLANKYTIEKIVESLTPVQQKRYELHYIQGYSATEIARIEDCDESSVRESIESILKKIKKYFI